MTLDFLSRSHVNLVLGVFKIRHVDFFFVALGAEQGSLVDQVFQVGTGKSRGALGQHNDVDIRRNGGLFHVHFQDFLAALDVRQGNDHLTVETARDAKAPGPERRGGWWLKSG
jgi:hypothetical protein